MASPVASGLTGTMLLLRLMLRRERLTIAVTFGVFVLLNASTAASIASAYPTPQARAEAQTGLGANAAFRFLLGPLDHVDSTASLTVWRAGLFLIAALGVCVVLLVVRQTRKEEELGRAELVRAAVTGPLAPMAAAAVVAAVFGVVVAAGMSLMLFPLGADALEVLAVFAQYATVGLAAAGTALVTAQIARTSHIANMAAAPIILVGYLLRGVADAAGGWSWLRWVTPIGWAQLIDPFGADNLWFALPSCAVFAGGVAVAAVLSTRRDLGAGLIAPRPGPASASGLTSIEAVTARLTLPLLWSWVGAVFAYGLIVGFLQPSVDDLAQGNEVFADIMRQSGVEASLGTLFGVTLMAFFAVAASAWAVNVATRLRAEENAGRTEMLLATPTSRIRYLRAHLVFVTVGVLGILVAAATAMTLGAWVAGGDAAGLGWAAVRSAAAQVPAALLVSSIALLLYALRPALVPLGWLVVVVALFLGPMSGMFNPPRWLADLSPFTHSPLVPVEPMNWVPVVVMLCLAGVVAGVSTWRFRVRQIG
ncbi:ABC transporter permease [Gordonia jinghuaiqii]|uniref:ABC transporter permease n=1 Tax=Gordonia jinghuaiqii TaxID=2758710 RepID=UPI002948C2DA|nr:ABC transporter permease [Gordonia jinghuaiqii]